MSISDGFALPSTEEERGRGGGVEEGGGVQRGREEEGEREKEKGERGEERKS